MKTPRRKFRIKTSKRRTWRMTVRGERPLSEIARVASSLSPKYNRLIVFGESAFVQSGVVASVKMVSSNGPYFYAIASPDLHLLGRKGRALSIRFADSARTIILHTNFSGDEDPCVIHVLATDDPPRVGERFYVQELPEVYGTMGPAGRPGLRIDFVEIGRAHV